MGDEDITARIERMFTYHPPRGTQVERYGRLREAAKQFVSVIADCTPETVEQYEAIRAARESVMFANAAIACNEEDLLGQ